MVKDILRFDTANTSCLEKFLTRYNNWVLQKSRTNVLRKPKAKSEPGGIPCFHWKSIDNISNCKDSTIAIDALGEGVPALLEIKDSLDADKFYIFFLQSICQPVPGFQIKDNSKMWNRNLVGIHEIGVIFVQAGI